MEFTQQQLGKGKVRFDVSLDHDEWERFLDQAASQLAASFTIKGFRPGKAPRKVVINTVGEAKLLAKASELAMAYFYPQVISKSGLSVAASPKLAVQKVSLAQPIEFAAEVLVLPPVKLADYHKIEVTVPVARVAPEEVEKVLNNFLRREATFRPVEREVKKGDFAEIDFAGTIEGKAFEGGSSKNHPLVVGENVFVPPFEEHLIGMKKGELREFDLTFPQDFHKSQLAGKKAHFSVTVKSIKEIVLPKLTDEFVEKVSRFKTVAQLREDVEKFLLKEKQTRLQQEAIEKAVRQLREGSQFELPEELVNMELEAMVDNVKQRGGGGDEQKFQTYLASQGLNLQSLREKFLPRARERVATSLVLREFISAEKIGVSEEVVDKELERRKQSLDNLNEEQKKKELNFWDSREGRSYLKNSLVYQKALERLSEISLKKQGG